MTDDSIPEDIRDFILQYIDSIAQWEGLLLLRADPQTQWNAAKIAQRLYINQTDAAQLLATLAEQGFLTSAAGSFYRYQTISPSREALIEKVAASYARSLVPITRLIHSKPKSKVQKFADAFRIRKD